nr:hypothetical protein [Schumannella soli]
MSASIGERPIRSAGGVALADECERGDDDLHLRADRAQRALPVAMPCRVEGGGAGEQEIGEDVGKDLIDPALILIAFRGAEGVFLGGAPVGDGSCTKRARARPEVAGVFDGLPHAGETVEDRVADHHRNRRDEIAHPVLPRVHAHAPRPGGILVSFGEGSGGELLGVDLETGAHPVRGVGEAAGEGFGFELGPPLDRHDPSCGDDDVHVTAADQARLPRIQGVRVVLDHLPGIADARLHGAIGESQHPAELRRDRPQRHLVRPHTRPRPRRLQLGERAGVGEHPHFRDLRRAHPRRHHFGP